MIKLGPLELDSRRILTVLEHDNSNKVMLTRPADVEWLGRPVWITRRRGLYGAAVQIGPRLVSCRLRMVTA